MLVLIEANSVCASSVPTCCAGVPYVLASGTKLAFGQPEAESELSFEEQAAASGSAMFETVLRGMAAGSSDEVKRRIEESLRE